ncbi:uncharacterized protein B0I36DRAFT_337591 [Microdochium trichocladiopsis]|uniref:Secreted protein n=1 Tax=Microdochium trichocladiopsis TaxID=1682393 RepID=A0A9P9BJ62_9PEZI|nr:uncharacterized protein B0I36DRAFT_337591 [Microdochium trichocladiopsis]KAH7016403.1 hypothetical protein B0I36DRAFT_337591 [Microdochium trichocladiopsis]
MRARCIALVGCSLVLIVPCMQSSAALAVSASHTQRIGSPPLAVQLASAGKRNESRLPQSLHTKRPSCDCRARGLALNERVRNKLSLP